MTKDFPISIGFWGANLAIWSQPPQDECLYPLGLTF